MYLVAPSDLCSFVFLLLFGCNDGGIVLTSLILLIVVFIVAEAAAAVIPAAAAMEEVVVETCFYWFLWVCFSHVCDFCGSFTVGFCVSGCISLS